MATFPTPPADGSGGYLEITATDAIDAHKIRVHVAPFTLSTLTTPFNYPYVSAHGSETGVNDTAQAVMNAIKIGWDNSWGLFVSSLVRLSGGVYTPIFPVPAATASGTNGLAAVQSYDIARATVNTFSMHSSAGGERHTRFVLKLPSWGAHHDELNSNTNTTGEIPGLPQLAEANSSGDVWEKVVYYLTGGAAANGVRAHDGGVPIGFAHVSIAENARLKRRYGFD